MNCQITVNASCNSTIKTIGTQSQPCRLLQEEEQEEQSEEQQSIGSSKRALAASLPCPYVCRRDTNMCCPKCCNIFEEIMIAN